MLPTLATHVLDVVGERVIDLTDSAVDEPSGDLLGPAEIPQTD